MEWQDKAVIVQPGLQLTGYTLVKATSERILVTYVAGSKLSLSHVYSLHHACILSTIFLLLHVMFLRTSQCITHTVLACRREASLTGGGPDGCNALYSP